VTTRRAAIAGAAATIAVVEVRSAPTDDGSANRSLDLPNGRWTAVVTAQELAAHPVSKFTTQSVAGFVSLQADGTPIAVSGVCTHKGCQLQLNAAEGRLDCPCHKTAFAPDGTLLFHQLPARPASLTRLHVRRKGETIEALLPDL
jgi:cytochrome b6-f complex iron-sulfur subunit